MLFLDSANAIKILKAIIDFGFGSLDIKETDLTKKDSVIQLGHPPLRIDLLTSIDGVHFGECYLHKKIIKIDGIPVNFIGYADLIKNKRASGRHQDLGDIENLEK